MNGVVGGSMMMAGTLMLCGGPVGWAVGGGLMAASVLGNTAKTGKTNEEHIARDGIRDMFKSDQLNFMDKTTGNVTLADGSVYRLDNENDDDRHSVAHPELLVGDQKAGGKDDRSGQGGLRAYDCDYTNDLDFFSTMGGQTLTRLVAGKADTATDQMGCELGNAGIANIGYGQPMTEDNFNKMVANQRAFYSKLGIGSKEDAAQLANQAFAEGRIDELQHTQAMQSIGMIFDPDGFQVAQKLSAGRQKGVEAAQANAAAGTEAKGKPMPLPAANVPAESMSPGVAGMAAGAPSIRPSYIPPAGTAAVRPKPEDYQDIFGDIVSAGAPAYNPNAPIVPYARRSSGMALKTKDELRAMNASRFQTAMA